MVIDSKFIGKTYPESLYEIGREKVKEFIRATKGDLSFYDETLPLTFPVVYASGLLEAILYDKELNLNLSKLVHGDQEFTYHTKARIGDVIKSFGIIENIFNKKGHDFVVFKVESFNQLAELVCTQRMTFVVRGGNDVDFSFKEKFALKLAAIAAKFNPFEKKVSTEISLPEYQRLSDSEFTMKVFIDKYLPQRYAGASGDFNAIHLDDSLGKESGLGGYILHGMATMALAANLAVYYHGADSIKAFKARFSKPVSPSDTLIYEAKLNREESSSRIEIIARDEYAKTVLEQAYLDLA